MWFLPFAAQLHECFFSVFNVEKSRRVGELTCLRHNLELNPAHAEVPDHALALLAEHRTRQRGLMDRLFYDADTLRSYAGKGGRVVIFGFMRGAGIFLQRLVEVSGHMDLSNVIVVCLPFPDNISRAGGVDEREAYRRQHGVEVRACVSVSVSVCVGGRGRARCCLILS